MEKIKVIYIAGFGRSGSTLLDRMLGQIDNFFSVGEIKLIWERSFEENQLCGCNNPFHQCPFWTKITENTFGGFQHVDIASIKMQRHMVQRMRYLPQLFFPTLRTNIFNDALNKYPQVLAQMYKEIARESGCNVIIDSSKEPLHALILQTIKEIDLYILHLVRNSNAVAYSWQRKKIRPEIQSKTEFMPRYSPWKSAWDWNKMNTLFLLIKGIVPRYELLRYEDLIASPTQSINSILYNFGLQEKLPETNEENIVQLGSNHMVSGNPMRFKRGHITLKSDNEWHAKMPFSHRLTVAMLTWPLLVKLGYAR